MVVGAFEHGARHRHPRAQHDDHGEDLRRPDACLESAADPRANQHVGNRGDDLLLFAKALGSSSGELNPVLAARYEGATGQWRTLPSAPGSGYQAWGIDGIVVLNPHFGLAATGGIFDPASETWSALH